MPRKRMRKRMPDMELTANYPRLTVEETADRLVQLAQCTQHAVVLFHARPDGDAVGSAFALRSLLSEMGMQVRCLCANAVPARLRFLTSDAEDAVEEETLPEAFRQKDVAVISVDTASPAQMGALAAQWQQRVMLMIDHHETGTLYAPALIDPKAAATGELIYTLAQELMARGCIRTLSLQACTALYAAISSDTGSFRYSNVTGRTFEIAAALRAQGVDTAQVSHALFESKPITQMTAEHLGFSVMQLWQDGRVAVIPFSYEMKVKNGLSDEDLETLVDMARAIEGVEIVLSVRQPQAEERFRVSTRSSGAFCVAPLCARFGGGGHAKAAGCTVEAESMEAVLSLLKAALDAEQALQNV